MGKDVILVTGANGQLGQCIRKVSEYHSEYDYIFTDINELDITSQKAVRTFVKQNRVNVIINTAAYTAVDKAESDFDTANLLNNVAVHHLIKEVYKQRIKLIHISTDYVFNGSKNTPYSTNDKPMPKTIYGRTKFLGEKILMGFPKNVAIVRTSWLYSEYGSNFVKTMLKLGKEKDRLNVVFDQTGSPTYAMDLAEFLIGMINKVVNTRITHYSNEGVCSWYDFARKIMQYANLDCSVLPVLSSEFPTPAPRPYYSVLDKSETKTFYHIEIPHWEDSIRKCIDNLMKG